MTGKTKNWMVVDGELYSRLIKKKDGKLDDRSQYFFNYELLTDEQAIGRFPDKREWIESKSRKETETEIIRLHSYGEGLSFREIQKKLSVSPNTIRKALDKKIIEMHDDDVFMFTDEEIREALNVDQKAINKALKGHYCHRPKDNGQNNGENHLE